MRNQNYDGVSKSEDFGHTREKAICHDEIIEQTLQLGKNELRCATLPAQAYLFETALTHKANKSGISVKFDCAEKGYERAIQSFKHIPSNCRLTLAEFDNMMEGRIVWRDKINAGFYDKNLPLNAPMYNVVWPDLCGEATEENLKSFVNMLRYNIEPSGGIGYITFYLVSRKNGKEDYFKRFVKYGKSKKINKLIRVTLNRLINSVKNSEIRLVYDVAYQGIGGQPMLTIGYSVNVKKGQITPVIEDRLNLEVKFKRQRYSTAYRLMKSNWKINRQGRPITKKSDKVKGVKKVKKNKKTQNLPLYLALRYYEAKWDNMDQIKKIAVSSKFGMSIRQFGGRIAMFHGKFKAKREAKQKAA